MQYRRFPAIDRDVSCIGFGTWPLAGELELSGRPVGRGRVDVDEARRSLTAALIAGVNFFDTAPTYGEAETLLGEALSRRGGGDVVVCTKFGIRVTPQGDAVQDFDGPSLIESIENSLGRLRRERIDVLLLHSPRDDFNWWDYDERPLELLQADGKIGCYGVSCHSVAGADRVLRHGFGSAIEVIYNALDRRAEASVLDRAANSGVAVIARVPLAQGFLTSRFLEASPQFDETDHRSTFTTDERNWLSDSARRLSFLDELPGGMTVSSLRFCLSHPAVTTAIPGMRSPEQAFDNTLAAKLGPLDPVTLEKIARAVPDVYSGWQRKESA